MPAGNAFRLKTQARTSAYSCGLSLASWPGGMETRTHSNRSPAVFRPQRPRNVSPISGGTSSILRRAAGRALLHSPLPGSGPNT